MKYELRIGVDTGVSYAGVHVGGIDALGIDAVNSVINFPPVYDSKTGKTISSFKTQIQASKSAYARRKSRREFFELRLSAISNKYGFDWQPSTSLSIESLYTTSMKGCESELPMSDLCDVLHMWHQHRGVKLRQSRIDKTEGGIDSNKSPIVSLAKYIETERTIHGSLSGAFLAIYKQYGRIRGLRTASRDSVITEVKRILDSQSWLQEVDKNDIIDAFLMENSKKSKLATSKCPIFADKKVAQLRNPHYELFSALNTLVNARVHDSDGERRLTNLEIKKCIVALEKMWKISGLVQKIQLNSLLKKAGINAKSYQAALPKINVPYTLGLVCSIAQCNHQNGELSSTSSEFNIARRILDLLLTPYIDDYTGAVEDILGRKVTAQQESILDAWSCRGRGALSVKAVKILNCVLSGHEVNVSGIKVPPRNTDEYCLDYYDACQILQWNLTNRKANIISSSHQFVLNAIQTQVNACLCEVDNAINAGIVKDTELNIRIRVELPRELISSEKARQELQKQNQRNQNINKLHASACLRHGASIEGSRRRFVKFLSQGGTVDKDGIQKTPAICAMTGRELGLADVLMANNVNLDHVLNVNSSGVDQSYNVVLCDSTYNQKVKKDKLPSELPHEDYNGLKQRLATWSKSCGKEFKKTLECIDFSREQVESLAPSSLAPVSSMIARQIHQQISEQLNSKYPGAQISINMVYSKQTAGLRREWGLHNLNQDSGQLEPKDRHDFRNHSIDAFVISLVDDNEYSKWKKKKSYKGVPFSQIEQYVQDYNNLIPVRIHGDRMAVGKYAPNPIRWRDDNGTMIASQNYPVGKVVEKLFEMLKRGSGNGFKTPANETFATPIKLVEAMCVGGKNHRAPHLPIDKMVFLAAAKQVVEIVQKHNGDFVAADKEIKQVSHLEIRNGVVAQKVRVYLNNKPDTLKVFDANQDKRCLVIEPKYTRVYGCVVGDNIVFSTNVKSDVSLSYDDEIVYSSKDEIPVGSMLTSGDSVFYLAGMSKSVGDIMFKPSGLRCDARGKTDREVLYDCSGNYRSGRLPMQIRDKSLWLIRRNSAGVIQSAMKVNCTSEQKSPKKLLTALTSG